MSRAGRNGAEHLLFYSSYLSFRCVPSVFMWWKMILQDCWDFSYKSSDLNNHTCTLSSDEWAHIKRVKLCRATCGDPAGLGFWDVSGLASIQTPSGSPDWFIVCFCGFMQNIWTSSEVADDLGCDPTVRRHRSFMLGSFQIKGQTKIKSSFIHGFMHICIKYIWMKVLKSCKNWKYPVSTLLFL